MPHNSAPKARWVDCEGADRAIIVVAAMRVVLRTLSERQVPDFTAQPRIVFQVLNNTSAESELTVSESIVL
jgi:hypothetical protein